MALYRHSILVAALLSTNLWAKGLPTNYSGMNNGHADPTSLSNIQRDSLSARTTLEPQRYADIVKDPSKARTDQERLAAIAAREIIFMVDRSATMMAKDEDPSGRNRKGSGPDGMWTRWDSAQEAAASLIEVALSLDSNGALDIVLWDTDRFMPRQVHKQIHNTAELQEFFNKNKPERGETPLAETLDWLYQTKLKAMLEKPTPEPFTVIVFTDGLPGTGFQSPAQAQDKVHEFFQKLVTTHHLNQSGRESLAAFSFLRSGDDAIAFEFLRKLDDDLRQGYTDSKGQRQNSLGLDIVDHKEDNFLFGTSKNPEYTGKQQGPMAIFWEALFD